MVTLDDCTLHCPACDAPIILPLTQTGADLTSITLAINLAAVRQHIAIAHPHPMEHPMSAIADRVHQLVTQLETEEHHLADEARTIFNRYEREAAAVVDGVKPVLDDLRAGITADVKDAVARVEAAAAKVEALVKQTPAAS